MLESCHIFRVKGLRAQAERVNTCKLTVQLPEGCNLLHIHPLISSAVTLKETRAAENQYLKSFFPTSVQVGRGEKTQLIALILRTFFFLLIFNQPVMHLHLEASLWLSALNLSRLHHWADRQGSPQSPLLL